jgi:glycosyltransferase involved in cell wall biosynthesis
MRRRRAVLITPSEQVRLEILDRFEVDESRVFATPLGVVQLPEAIPFRAERPYVLAVATLEPRKNLSYLLEAYQRSRLKRTHDLRLVGRPGWNAPPLPNVTVMTAVDDVQLSALYRGAAALISPSIYEGFGLPLIEAMSLGVPTLCSDIPVHREVTGGLVEYFSLEDLDDLVWRLDRIADPQVEQQGLWRSWAARFTWDACADATILAYRRAAQL